MDGISGDYNAEQMWKIKYSVILKSVHDICDRRDISSIIESFFNFPIVFCFCYRISVLVDDGIPSELHKNAPVPIFCWLTRTIPPYFSEFDVFIIFSKSF